MLQIKKAEKKNNKNKKNATTVQQTIAYEAAYVNGIFKVGGNLYSKSYSLSDINFRMADGEEQEELFLRFTELLNSLSEARIQITCFNTPIDKEEFQETYFVKYKSDDNNDYRDEINNVLLSHLEGKGSIKSQKYLTLTIEATDIDTAVQQFSRLDVVVINAANAVGESVATPLTLEQRLTVLHDMLNVGEDDPFYFDIDSIISQKISTKDVIAPDSMMVMKDYMTIGDTYACTLFLDTYPSTLSTEFMAELNETPFCFASSVHLSCISQEKSMKLISRQLTNINAQVQSNQRKLKGKGVTYDTMSPDLRNAKEEAEKLRVDLSSRNQKLYYATVVVTVYAPTKEKLQDYIKVVQTTGRKYMCSLKKLSYQQDKGLCANLPIGNNELMVQRMLTTESASLFIPYSSEEITQKGGFYYGLNSISNNMIIYNRLNSRNANGLYLGSSGSGKSFAAKRELINVLLATDDYVYVVDPDKEYVKIADALGGEVIRIAAGANRYINPLDMNIKYAEGDSGQDDPVSLKADFVRAICETAVGGKYGLPPIQRSIVDRCVRELYAPYMEYLASHPGEFENKEITPTLLDFYNLLKAQGQPEAQNLALALELYCKGSLDIFAHKTNINSNSRFIVFDIKDIGTGLKELGLKVCLNEIWNRTIENKGKNKRTWFYLDEFYILTKTASSAEFIQEIFKRARKWNGVPTGITQDVEDLLDTPESRAVINNCDFIMMFNQQPIPAEQLSEMYHLSPAQRRHIKNAPSGHGLMYNGRSIIPFDDNYPQDTKMYKLLETSAKKQLEDE